MYISGVEGKTPSIEQNDLMERKSSSSSISGSNNSSGSKKVTDKKNESTIVKKDMEKAFSFAYKACELKNVYACANLSQMYARGEGTEKNVEKAEKFKKMAIDMQNELKNSTNNSQLGIHQMA